MSEKLPIKYKAICNHCGIIFFNATIPSKCDNCGIVFNSQINEGTFTVTLKDNLYKVQQIRLGEV